MSAAPKPTAIHEILLKNFSEKLGDLLDTHLPRIAKQIAGGDDLPANVRAVTDVELTLSAVQGVLADRVLKTGARPDRMTSTTFVLMGMQSHVEESARLIRDRVVETAKAEQPAAGPN